MAQKTIYDSVPLPLSSAVPQIRLLTLTKGSGSDALDIALSVATLTEEDPPAFEALSYAWGAVDKTSSVTARADRGERDEEEEETLFSLEVTDNLASALWHLRLADRDRVLWADAVCIDQGNKEERSSQVANMANVYRLASRVVVWLGPSSLFTELAMECLSLLSSKIRVDWKTYSILPSESAESAQETHWADYREEMPFDEVHQCAIQNLFARSWFYRLWVLQEVRLSRDAVVQCGHRSLPWLSVMGCILTLQVKGCQSRAMMVAPPHLNEGKREGEGGVYESADWLFKTYLTLHNPSIQHRLTHLMHLSSAFRCADDRDRVYALPPLAGLSLADLEVVPDYTATVHEVYRDFVLRYMAYYLELDILITLSPGSSSSSSSTGGGCTWVPSFHAPMETNFITLDMASGDLAADWDYLGTETEGRMKGKDILLVKGVHCAVIESVDVTHLGSEDLRDIRHELVRLTPRELRAEVMSRDASDGTSGSSSSRALQDFAATLTCLERVTSEPPDPSQPTVDKAVSFLTDFLHHTPESIREADFPDAVFAMCYRMQDDCRGRAMAVIGEGRFALVPGHARPGDVLGCLLGMQTLAVLRPVREGEGETQTPNGNDDDMTQYYELIGPAFAYSLGLGMAVLGPLEAPWCPVIQYSHEVGGHLQSYRNTETGETRYGDPRLDSIKHETRGGPWDKVFVNYEDLAKRDVHVRDFLLV